LSDRDQDHNQTSEQRSITHRPELQTAVRKKIDPLSLKSFRHWLARKDLARHSHSGGTTHVHQKP
jgi:hypothetical protein